MRWIHFRYQGLFNMTDGFDSSPSTSTSLLRRVRAKEQAAWRKFAAIYSPLVYYWARSVGLQANDAEDIVQDVFHTVFNKIGDFQNDGQNSRFRNWLWAVTRNRIRLYFRQKGPQPQATGGSTAAQLIQELPDWIECETEPSKPDGNAGLIKRALGTIEGDFSSQSWQAFWRVAIDNVPVAEVADQLGLTTAAVRQAKYRVLCRLRDELQGL